MKKAIICDIDGTIAVRGDRGHFDWDKVSLDSPKDNNVVWLLHTLNKISIDIILFSGRDGSCRGLTEKWLQDNQVPYSSLYMRTAGDFRKDSIVKKELYELNIKGKYEIMFVLDDRNQVVDMWRKELNLTCLQVDYGDF